MLEQGFNVGKRLPLLAETHEGNAALACLDEEWDALVARQSQPNPTLCSAWLAALAETTDRMPVVALVRDEGRLVAGAAMCIATYAGVMRTAGWLGAERLRMTPTIITEPSRAGLAVDVLNSMLRRSAWVRLKTTPLDDPGTVAVREAFPQQRHSVGIPRFLMPIPAPRRTVVEKDCRGFLRRAERRGVNVEIRTASSAEDVTPAMDRLFELYAARWRGRGDQLGRFSTIPWQRDWYRSAVRRMAEQRKVLITEVWEDGRPVASGFGMVHGHGALFHTTAMAAGGTIHSPGALVLTEWLRKAEEFGATTVNLGRGSGERGSVKARLGATPHPVGDLLVARTRGAYAAHWGARNARMIGDRVAPRARVVSRAVRSVGALQRGFASTDLR
jgi:CelD/BcsL family acetyltransferase involved in cellulose biosynthesis